MVFRYTSEGHPELIPFDDGTTFGLPPLRGFITNTRGISFLSGKCPQLPLKSYGASQLAKPRHSDRGPRSPLSSYATIVQGKVIPVSPGQTSSLCPRHQPLWTCEPIPYEVPATRSFSARIVAHHCFHRVLQQYTGVSVAPTTGGNEGLTKLHYSIEAQHGVAVWKKLAGLRLSSHARRTITY